MKNIVLFASSTGSNAEKIMQHFAGREDVAVAALFTNNPNAAVISKAGSYDIPSIIFTREELNNGTVLEQVNAFSPGLIVLAGFLWKFPADIIAAYPHKV